jgi:Na+-transporting NADH:ubiquinone oxidoreductase subunit NqrC
MKEEKLLQYLIAKAEREGEDTNTTYFKDKINRAREYIAKRKDYIVQQQNIEKTAQLISKEINKEISKIKFDPQINIPEIPPFPDKVTVKNLDEAISKIKIPTPDLDTLNSNTKSIVKVFDNPIQVVLTDPQGNEYTAEGGGGAISTKHLATSAKQDSIITELEKITTDITVDPFRGYGLYAVDSDDATYFYIMYQNTSGAWIVLRITLATGITLYSTGDSDASTNWGNRSSLTYADYENTFN